MLRHFLLYIFLFSTLPLRLLSPSWWRDWQQRHRLLFRFHDGRGWRAIDPLLAVMALNEHQEYRGDLHPRLVEQGDPEAIQITLRAVKQVFAVEDYEPATRLGLTLGEQLHLLYTFSRYLELLKKSTAPWPTAPRSTASTSDRSTAPDPPATTNSL